MMGSAFFGSFIAQALVIVFGWYVVHKLTFARDMDKARREMIAKASDHMIENLTGLLGDIYKYHLSDRDISLELKIKNSIQDVSMRISGLHDICKQKDNVFRCTRSIGAIRRSATKMHFEDGHRGRLTENDFLLEDVAASVIHAKQDLLRLKYAQFSALP